MEPQMLKIIHLSDLHLEEAKITNRDYFIEKLIGDLKERVDHDTILCITGDMIDKGGASFPKGTAPFEYFNEIFIKKLIREIPEIGNRIFFTPGNHDIQRDKLDEYGLPGIRSLLNSERSVNEFIEKNINSSRYLDHLNEYNSWIITHTKNIDKYVCNNFFSAGIISIGSLKVGIASLNSSWLCYNDTPKGDVIVGTKQVEDALSIVKSADIKIALVHHPIEYIIDFEKENLKRLLYRDFNILLTGHVHEIEANCTQCINGNLFTSIATATTAPYSISRNNYKNGYSVIEYIPNENVKVTSIKYIEQTRTFVNDTDVGNNFGTVSYSLPKNEETQKYFELQGVVSAIENRFFEKLNNHIVTLSATSKATSTLDGIFVEPTIQNAPAGSLKKENTVSYAIDDIISSNSNFVIMGGKESGKTILIDKLFKECGKRFSNLKKVPLLFKFAELHNREIDNHIQEFLGVSKEKYRQIIASTSLVLFIDDVKFTEINALTVDKITKYISTHNNIQLIVTTDQVSDISQMIQVINRIVPTRINIAYIHNFSSKQISKLVEKWYDGRPVDFQEKIENIIKCFSELGLPKNPLAITMFLWIFETQEKRPMNNSVLVESYVEKLLEKANFENSYSETFDFTNKQRLLSFIAKHLRDVGDANLGYCLSYAEVLVFVESYLKKKYHLNPRVVLDDCLKRGILFQDELGCVRFKFAFLFHYFLALHFDNDATFLPQVLTGNDFLNYVDEISYYTGLKRHHQQILEFSQAKLHETFAEINAEIVEKHDQIDKHFEVKDAKETFTWSLNCPERVDDKLIEKNKDKVYDDQLDSIQTKSITPKKDIVEANLKKRADAVLRFAAIVFKNSEEVDDFDLRTTAFQSIITSSISMLIIDRERMRRFYEENKGKPELFPENFQYELFQRFFPLIYQVMLHNWMGNPKFRPIFDRIFEQNMSRKNISEYEVFLLVFLYSDMRGAHYPDKIEEFIKGLTRRYLKDLTFVKILSYFHLRKNGENLDKRYIKIMSRIQAELQHGKNFDKGKFIQKLENEKKKT